MNDKRTIDELAQEIRRVDGENRLGAGALAEALQPFLTELQHRREGAVAQADVRDPIMLIADELVVIAANCASRNDGRAVRDVSRKLYALAASPSSPASVVRVTDEMVEKAMKAFDDGASIRNILLSALGEHP